MVYGLWPMAISYWPMAFAEEFINHKVPGNGHKEQEENGVCHPDEGGIFHQPGIYFGIAASFPAVAPRKDSVVRMEMSTAVIRTKEDLLPARNLFWDCHVAPCGRSPQ